MFTASFTLDVLNKINKVPLDTAISSTVFTILSLSVCFLQMDIQQAMLYCDPSLAMHEACCEIPGARVRVETLTVFTSNYNFVWSRG